MLKQVIMMQTAERKTAFLFKRSPVQQGPDSSAHSQGSVPKAPSTGFRLTPAQIPGTGSSQGWALSPGFGMHFTASSGNFHYEQTKCIVFTTDVFKRPSEETQLKSCDL